MITRASLSPAAEPERPDALWVRAEPFAAHFRRLVAATRLPWRVVAMAARIPAPLAHGLLQGRSRRLPIAMARRIMTLTPETLAALREHPVRARVAAQHTARLRAAGFTWPDVAEFAALSQFETRRLARGDGYTSVLTTLRLAAAAEAHGLYYAESSEAAA